MIAGSMRRGYPAISLDAAIQLTVVAGTFCSVFKDTAATTRTPSQTGTNIKEQSCSMPVAAWKPGGLCLWLPWCSIVCCDEVV
jgi:hypothetical protein